MKTYTITITPTRDQALELRVLRETRQKLYNYGITTTEKFFAFRVGPTWQTTSTVEIIDGKLVWTRGTLYQTHKYDLADPGCFDKITIDILSSPSTRSAVYDRKKFLRFFAERNIKSSNGKPNQKLSIR